MSWDAIGALAELLGAAGVIATLVYVTIQVRQNTIAVRTSAYQEAVRDQAISMDQLNADADLNRIFYEGLKDLSSLDINERRRFATYMTSAVRRLENVLYQTRVGTIDPDGWAGIREHMKFVFMRPGAQEWFSSSKNLFTPEVVEFIERDLEIAKRSDA